MKIGILTQPLLNNYGGLLQNYALQKILIDLGHEPLTINIVYSKNNPLKDMINLSIRVLLKISGRKIRVFNTTPSEQESNYISQYTSQFVANYIKTTKLIKRKVNSELLNEYNFGAYIVGSDQVWRSIYSPQLSTYFLDFVKENNSIRNIAYSASFGIEEWQFNKKQTKKFGELLQKFDAISVREDTAVKLCKKYFNVNATHLLDPTMLVEKDVYTSIVEKIKVNQSPGNLFTYILDKSFEKNKIVEEIANKYELTPFSVMPLINYHEPGERNLNDCVYPPLEKWLRGFIDAKFVVTDSFHGTIFSILFNKPFITLVNRNRGLCRFTSLLNLFNLEYRLIDPFNIKDFTKLKEIEWEKINSILSREKNKSIQFLKKHLS